MTSVLSLPVGAAAGAASPYPAGLAHTAPAGTVTPAGNLTASRRNMHGMSLTVPSLPLASRIAQPPPTAGASQYAQKPSAAPGVGIAGDSVGLPVTPHTTTAKGDASVRFRSPSRSMSSMTTTNLSSTSKSTSLLMARGPGSMLGSQTSTAVSSTGSVSLTGTVGALTGSRGASSVHVDRFDLGRSSSRVALPEPGTISPMPGRPRAHTEAFAPPVRSVSAARVRMPTSPTRAQQTELKPTWYGSATMIGRKAGHVTNQDVIAASVYEDYNILAVCDGHGAEGHRVAQASKGVLLKSLESQLTAGVEVKKALVDAFQMAERNLPLMLGREVVAFSGTTATVAAVKGSQVTFAHVGDSTGCVYRVANGNATLVCRTRDHVPNIPEERARILRAGGRVSEETFGGVSAFRVYQSGQNLPGLAMSRSLGDSVAHMCGVSSEPEIKDWLLDSPPASAPGSPGSPDPVLLR